MYLVLTRRFILWAVNEYQHRFDDYFEHYNDWASYGWLWASVAYPSIFRTTFVSTASSSQELPSFMCLLLETLHVWCWSADWMTKCCHLCPNISALQHRVWSATMQHGRLEAVGPSIWNSHHTLLPLFPPLFKKWLKTIYFGLTVVRERPHVMSYFEDRLHKK